MDKQNRFVDEMFDSAGQARQPYSRYNDWFQTEDIRHLRRKSEEAEAFFRRIGITFNVYGQQEADERLIPFDVVPRIISAREWARLEDGIAQRVRAINAFLHDIYHRQEILRAGRVPVDLIARNEAFLPQMIGVNPPGGVYTHIVGTDLVRTAEGPISNDYYMLAAASEEKPPTGRVQMQSQISEFQQMQHRTM